MQRVELTHKITTLHCPFCGHCILGKKPGEEHESVLEPCEHTLFIACDEGFEYRSEMYDQLTSKPDDQTEDDIDESIDEITDSVDLPNGIKFASYVPAPGFMGSYFGFWHE